MKAAVIYQKGEMPQYTDVPEPVDQSDEEMFVSVKAVAIKHLDRSIAAGKHYSAHKPSQGGKIPGSDGVFLLEDGTRVYGIGVNGTLAEKALIHKSRIVNIPETLDDVTAAALPNAIIGAAMGLRFKGNIQPGDVVLINGATGFTGRMAVQIARLYGAGTIIATGRNQQSLNELEGLGADITLSLLHPDEAILTQLKAIHRKTPINIVIDYLWGHPAEMILEAIKGDGSFSNEIRYVSVGSMVGDNIQLSAAILRSIDIRISGSGLGSWSKAQVDQLFNEILPEMFQLAAEGRITVNTTTVTLPGISALWNFGIPDGHRLVVTV